MTRQAGGDREVGGPGRSLAILLVGFVGVVAFGLAFGAAQPYPGVTVDSGEYLAVAEGLSNGHGYTMPYVSYDEPFRVLEEGERVRMTQFPPLYPTLIGLGHSGTGLRLLDLVRLLGSVAFAATVWLVGVLVWRSTGSVLASAVAGGFLLAPDLVSIHSVAWTEPFMNLPMLGALFFLVRYVDRRTTGDLVLAGVCSSIAGLARFAGVAVVLGAAIALFIHANSKRESLRSVVWLALTALPAAAWFLGNTLGAGIASEKQLAWHLPKPADLGRAVQTVGGWLVPGRVPGVVAGILVIAAVPVIARTWSRKGAGTAVPLGRMCLVMGLAYTGFLLVYRSFMDQNVSFDFRILSPLHLLAVVGVCSTFGTPGRALPRWVTGVAILLALFTLGRGVFTAMTFTDSTTPGYTSQQWLDSELLRAVGELDADTAIVTNTPDAIWLRHRDSPVFLPIGSNLYTGEENAAFEEQLRAIRAELGCRTGVVAFFTQPTRKRARVIDPRTVEALELTRRRGFADGILFSTGPLGRCR